MASLFCSFGIQKSSPIVVVSILTLPQRNNQRGPNLICNGLCLSVIVVARDRIEGTAANPAARKIGDSALSPVWGSVNAYLRLRY